MEVETKKEVQMTTCFISKRNLNNICNVSISQLLLPRRSCVSVLCLSYPVSKSHPFCTVLQYIVNCGLSGSTVFFPIIS